MHTVTPSETSDAGSGHLQPGHVARLRLELGHRLARHRTAQGLTQTGLAVRTNYSRSTIGNVETGRQNVPRMFWVVCDNLLNSDGRLLAHFDFGDETARAYRTHMTGNASRHPAAAGHATTFPPLGHNSSDPAQRGSVMTIRACDCPDATTIALWTSHEIRALRRAMRLGVAGFAEYLRVASSTVTRWERGRVCGPPGMTLQQRLDQALTLVDHASRHRFHLLVRAGEPSHSAAPHAGRIVADVHQPMGTVVPLHRGQPRKTARPPLAAGIHASEGPYRG